MAKSRTAQIISVGSSSTAGYAILGIVGLGALYLLTQKGEGGSGQSTYKESIIEKIGSGIGNAASDVGSSIIQGAGNAVGEAVIGTGKKTIEGSEQKTSATTFNNEARTNVPGWFATGGSGKQFTQPVTYQQFIQEQPLAVRAPVALGNIITADYASKYGNYVAEETKKGQAAAGQNTQVEAQRFTTLNPVHQSLIGLGQAITVPFGGGGAVGWGAAKKKADNSPITNVWDVRLLFGGKMAQ